MNQPPLTESPLQWLKAVVAANTAEDDDHSLLVEIRFEGEPKDYPFTYRLGDIRSELRRRGDNLSPT